MKCCHFTRARVCVEEKFLEEWEDGEVHFSFRQSRQIVLHRCGTKDSPQSCVCDTRASAGWPARGIIALSDLGRSDIKKKSVLLSFPCLSLITRFSIFVYVSELFAILFCERFISFARFSVGLFIFFLLIYGNIFYIRKMSALSLIEVADIFPPFVICCFLFTDLFFPCKIFI